MAHGRARRRPRRRRARLAHRRRRAAQRGLGSAARLRRAHASGRRRPGVFDPADLTGARDEEIESALRARLPGVPWQAKNQAAVHLWYPKRFGLQVEPFASAAEAIATFPETATSVAARLERDDHLTVVAPYGLDDLLGLVHRHNPRRATVEVYEHRLATKRIAERWPRVTIVPAT